MLSCKVNGQDVRFEPGSTVLQVCEQAGVEIPRFCYHERLSIAGNCRMCLVEVKPGPPKPMASCALPAAAGMEILTDTEMVREARNGVMAFLLANHPLDCPICDQAGECDLQDQAMAYGRGVSRFREDKRAVSEKYMGPLIKTIMTRCIHCTRCIRFSTEIAGVSDMGLLGRGEHAEISTLERALASELSANVIDICPVGALTSRPYAFHARPWELRRTASIDVLDAVGSSIRIDARGNQVMRILPRLNEAINEEWIADKTRYACDGLLRQRLDRPYVRGADGRLHPASWEAALAAAAAGLKGCAGLEIATIAGDQADVETLYAAKALLTALGSPNIECRQDGAALDATCSAAYRFNSAIAGIEEAEALLIIGANPRWEAPMINARIRKRWLSGALRIAVIGERLDLTYDYDWLGAGPEALACLDAADSAFATALRAAPRPMLMVGSGALTRPDGAAILGRARALAERFGLVRNDWNGFNVLHRVASRVGALDIGFVPGPGGLDCEGILNAASAGTVKAVWLLGADEIEMARLGRAFVIYQGHHGDAGAHRADVILPGATYTEKTATYVNTEGRVQRTRRAVFPPGEAQEDWAIVQALSVAVGRTSPWKTVQALRAALYADYPHLAAIGRIAPSAWGRFGGDGAMDPAPFVTPITNFYMTCAISRASETMAQCSRENPLNVREAA